MVLQQKENVLHTLSQITKYSQKSVEAENDEKEKENLQQKKISFFPILPYWLYRITADINIYIHTTVAQTWQTK